MEGNGVQYQQLGHTDLIVSRICFGCWQLSPRFWGKVPLKDWREAVNEAVDLGINFIDTAGAYGDGYAETSLGNHLARTRLRDRFIIATKFYWNFRAPERHPDTSHEFIVQECEDSLRRLKTDRIDLLQIHAWDPLTRPDEVAAALGRLKHEGKVRWVGASGLNVEQLDLYRAFLDVVSLQPPYSLLDRAIEDRELPYCLHHRIGVIAYSPLFRGLLTGKYKAGHRFYDHRDTDPLFGGPPYERIREGIDELRPLAEKHDLTIPQFAIRWVLTHPALTSAIVGIKNARQISTIAPAADGVLPAPDWYKAAAVMKIAMAEAQAMKEDDA
jgi:aryl-alcohol dehydrogenase-like predicted oxidoreductase